MSIGIVRGEADAGGSVIGSVASSISGRPITNGLVRIYDTLGVELGAAALNGGPFTFDGLEPGTYYIHTDSDGFVTDDSASPPSGEID